MNIEELDGLSGKVAKGICDIYARFSTLKVESEEETVSLTGIWRMLLGSKEHSIIIRPLYGSQRIGMRYSVFVPKSGDEVRVFPANGRPEIFGKVVISEAERYINDGTISVMKKAYYEVERYLCSISSGIQKDGAINRIWVVDSEKVV